MSEKRKDIMANAGQAPIASALSETAILDAQRACEALAIEYAEIVDAQDYERLREIFTEDAILIRRSIAQEAVRGLDNIIASFTSRPRNRLTYHIMSNIRVRVETPETASGTCRVLLFTSDTSEPQTAEGRKVAPRQMMGTYHDRYVRTKDGWRFAERRGDILYYT
jgi:ketosteroid isomerase-like protein